MRTLDGLTLDLAPRQPGIGTRCLPAGAYWIVLVLVAMQALCPWLGSSASVAATGVLEPVVSAVQLVNDGAAVRDPFEAQSAASGLFAPAQDDHASSASMQAGDEVDPADDGLALGLATSSPLLSPPTTVLAQRLQLPRPVGRSEAPPDRPPTSVA
jgi:hypothetical protein